MSENAALVYDAETAVAAVCRVVAVVAHHEHASLRDGLRIGQVAHARERVDLLGNIRLVEHFAVDAHVARDGVDIDRVAAGRDRCV